MKKLVVSENCNGCGLCLLNTEYLKEDAAGNAEAVPGKAIQEADLGKITELVAGCPANALKIIEFAVTDKKGMAGFADIVSKLKEYADNFSVQRVKCSDVKWNTKNYSISVPRSRNEYQSKYSSERAARSAARDEFSNLCYSPSAYRPLLKKVFVEYKVQVLKPYYICCDAEDSVYYKYNLEIRRFLADLYAEIKELLGENNKISESWKDFSVYLKERGTMIEVLKDFDDYSTTSEIISALKDVSSSGIDGYIADMDFDYDEVYAGEGLFGNSKFKNMWYFSNFSEAAKSFIDDLTWAIDFRSDEIEELAVSKVNWALKEFEDLVKENLLLKVKELEKYVH